ncbi:MAG: hypothetical protein PUC05_08680 [Firmicutes bacterium]|nr:hypothetical protein [Bacillota bacterium]
MKRITAMLIIIAMVLILSSCTDPPVGEKTVTDIKQYGVVNKYVADTMEKTFAGILPETIPEQYAAAEYYYHYECGLVGDPEFIISLKITYKNASDFYAEQARVDKTADDYLDIDGKKYYLAGQWRGALESIGDDEIFDGKWVPLEMAVFDETALAAVFLTTMQTDNKKQSSYSDYITEVTAPLITLTEDGE